MCDMPDMLSETYPELQSLYVHTHTIDLGRSNAWILPGGMERTNMGPDRCKDIMIEPTRKTWAFHDHWFWDVRKCEASNSHRIEAQVAPITTEGEAPYRFDSCRLGFNRR